MKYIQGTEFYDVSTSLGEGYDLSESNSLSDFQAGKIILLSEVQEAFKLANPGATTIETFKCALNVAPQPTLQVLKERKIAQIEAYDNSEKVNSFTINGVSMWLDKGARTSLSATIAAYKANELTEITLWTTGQNPFPITLLISQLEALLVNLEMYAKACYDNKAQNKANVQLLNAKEEVNNYDVSDGYPEKLSVEI